MRNKRINIQNWHPKSNKDMEWSVENLFFNNIASSMLKSEMSQSLLTAMFF